MPDSGKAFYEQCLLSLALMLFHSINRSLEVMTSQPTEWSGPAGQGCSFYGSETCMPCAPPDTHGRTSICSADVVKEVPAPLPPIAHIEAW